MCPRSGFSYLGDNEFQRANISSVEFRITGLDPGADRIHNLAIFWNRYEQRNIYKSKMVGNGKRERRVVRAKHQYSAKLWISNLDRRCGECDVLLICQQEMRSEIIMRIQSRLFLLFAIAAIIGATQTVCSQEPLSITLRPSKGDTTTGTGVVIAGSPVYVLVDLKNNSDKIVSSMSIDYPPYYIIDVRDEEGYPTPETKFMRELRDPNHRGFGSGGLFQYNPGESWKEQLTITHYYEMSRPGKYTIQLERKLPEELGVGTVKSNTITITVVAPEPEAGTPQ